MVRNTTLTLIAVGIAGLASLPAWGQIRDDREAAKDPLNYCHVEIIHQSTYRQRTRVSWTR